MDKVLIKNGISACRRTDTIGKWGGICLFFACLTVNVQAQQANANLIELVRTENEFAQKALDAGIRSAFLANLDSAGILFSQAKPINGLEAYTPAPDDHQQLLSWYPTVAHVSSSGDLGFTSGPYQFFAERDKGPVGSGYFFSIWKKNRAGTFKLVLDGGVGNSKDHINAFKSNPKPANTGYDFLKMAEVSNLKNQDPWEAEKMFSNAAAIDPKKAYTQFLADASLMLRNDRQAGLSKSINLATIANEHTGGYQFRKISQDISERGDLAYCYGEVRLGGQDAKSGDAHDGDGRIGFFVRVWQFQPNGWKIVAEEISLVPQKKSAN